MSKAEYIHREINFEEYIVKKLAEQGFSRGMIGCSMTDSDLFCHFSGAEAQITRWLQSGDIRREDIAREIYDLLARTISRMLTAGTKKTGIRNALVTGGVASSVLFRDILRKRLSNLRDAPETVFGDPEMSGDNAVGVALIGVSKLAEQDVCSQSAEHE